MLDQTVIARLTLSTALVRQYDALTQQEISARYAYEMARARPQTSQPIARNTADHEAAYKGAQWELAQMDLLVERLTGLAIPALRTAADDLGTLVGRREEVAQELRNRTLLTPALIDALDAGPQTVEAKAALTTAKAAVAEAPTLQQHLATLDALALQAARAIDYRPVSDLTVVSSLTGLR